MPRRRAAPWALTIIFVLLGTSGAQAAKQDDEALLRDGVRLRREGKDEEALSSFLAAYQARATPRALAQIGLAEQALGHWVDAERHLNDALVDKTDPWISKNKDSLTKAVAFVADHLGYLQILGTPAGAKVRIDEQQVGELPMRQPVRAPLGEVVVSIAATGFLPLTRKVTVPGRGAIARETIALHSEDVGPTSTTQHPACPAAAQSDSQPAVVAAGSSGGDEDSGDSPSAESRPRSWQKTAALVGAATGLVVGAAGGTAQVLSSKKNQQFNDEKNAPNPTGQCNKMLDNSGGGRCQALVDRAVLLFKGAVIGYAAAGVVLVASAVLFFTAPSTPEKGREVAASCIPLGREGGASCTLVLAF